jgi:hypothetical protein
MAIGVIAALVIGFQVAAFAVHNEVFELEGDAVDDPNIARDDWENVFENTDNADQTAFVTEPNPNSSFFTGGGSKDPQDIPNWLWKDETGGLPDKANLQHSFAASYTEGGKELLYFGADRFDGSGDAAIAFWFFQNEVAQDPPPPPEGTATQGNFTGTHRNGDVLVISNFSNGGTVPTITVYKWDNTCTKADNNNPQAGQCGAANLRVVATSTSADCSNPNPDTACAIVNSATDDATAPWPFEDKDGNTEFAPGEFFEGGIDLTALGLADQCFATALAETRTSTSPTSVLKDFTIGKFGSCGSTTTTTPQDNAGNPIGTDGISIGTGSVQVRDSALVEVTGGGATTWSGTVSFFLCKVDAPGLCTTGGTAITPDQPVDNNPSTPATTTAVSEAATVTSAGRYCWRAEFSGDAAAGVEGSSDSAETECFTVNPVTPTLATSAGDDVTLGNPVTDTATLSGTANLPGSPVINPTTAGGKAGGTITFKLFGPGNCTEPAVFTSAPVTVSGDGNYTASFTPTDPGTYHWVATYSGNLPNTNGTSHNTDCTDANEDVVVSDTSVTTQQQGDASKPIGTGSIQVTDKATVNVTGAPTWNGTVQFSLTGPTNTQGVPEKTKTIGNPVAVSNSTPEVTSDAATVTAVGHYCWSAHFDSNTTGVPDGDDNGENECFDVTPKTPTLTTSAGADVLLGNPSSDTADLSGTATKPGTDANGDPDAINPANPGAPAGGDITFTAYGPNNCTTVAFGPSSPFAVSGNGTYPTAAQGGPVSFTPTAIGTYHWVATYSGDSPNTLGTDHNTACDDPEEDVDVTSVPSSISTAQSFIPNDSATVSAQQGGALAGSVTFKVFESSDCSGTALYTETVPVSGGSPQTVSTTNGSDPQTTKSTTAANVSWEVSYDSTNPAQDDIAATCKEATALTIDNDTTD